MKLPFKLGLRGELLLLLTGVLVLVVALFAALWWQGKRSNEDARDLSARAMRELAREGLLAGGHALRAVQTLAHVIRQLADALGPFRTENTGVRPIRGQVE